MSRFGPCMCGDIACPSCGPMQGGSGSSLCTCDEDAETHAPDCPQLLREKEMGLTDDNGLDSYAEDDT